ncbi:MAG: PIN domain-containing protein [Microscillaceae bacterium]|nr:PIN domain-containing protein [Microscillaceae bacterium]
MKRYVTDVNVLFSALMSGKELYLKIFTEFQFFLPDYALYELQKYQLMILEKTKLDRPTLQQFAFALFEKITIVPNLLISNQSYLLAFELCKDIDEKDLTYYCTCPRNEPDFRHQRQTLGRWVKEKRF